MSSPDFRQLCAEHLKAWDSDEKYNNHDEMVALIETTRAALAAEPQGPTDEEILQVYREVHQYRPDVVCHPIVVQEARAYLARFRNTGGQP